VPIVLHTTLAAACDEIEGLEANMRAVERQLAALASTMPDAQVLHTVPGVGLITATALVALVADIRRFPSGRHFCQLSRPDATRRLERVAETAGGDQ
jgi:transposase